MRVLGELARPVRVLGERDSLAEALEAFRNGRPALVLLDGVVHLVHPADVVGHRETRRLLDLPFARVDALAYDTPLWRALDRTRDDDFIVVSREGGDYAVASRQEVLEELLRSASPSAPERALTVIDVLDQSPEGVVVVDAKRCVHGLNPAARRMLALFGDVTPGEPIEMLGGVALASLLEDARDGLPRDIVLHDPAHKILSVRTLHAADGGDGADTVFLIRDVTNVRHRQAREAAQERMAMLGQITSGIAHDMNNVLTVVAGYASLMRAEPQRRSQYLSEVERAVGRASGLARQLLAFARKELSDPVVLDLPALVRDMEGILGRLAGEGVELRVEADDHTPTVYADPVQVERIVTNLVVNARNSMPRGGRLTVSVAPCPSCPHVRGSSPSTGGTAAKITVQDEGEGMPPETLARIFEPYFTTDPSRGTGLGLATVHATVTQLRGVVRVSSSVGEGSRFEICLPGVSRKDTPAPPPRPPTRAHADTTGTLLVAESDQQVAGVVRNLLESTGYSVATAATAEEAIEHIRSRGEPDLLLADVSLRTSEGELLSDRLRVTRPNLRVLLMSGFSSAELSQQTRSPLVEHIAKPFSGSMLIGQVERMVGASDDS